MRLCAVSLFAGCLAVPAAEAAQQPSDSTAIAAVIGDYARGWREADIPLLQQVFMPNGVTMWPGGGARDSLNALSFADLLGRRRPRPDFARRWEMRSLEVVDGVAAVATVWFDDEPRGVVDLLTLYKLGGRWRIVSKAFVVESEPNRRPGSASSYRNAAAQLPADFAVSRAPDTIFAEVGSAAIDGRILRPHAARVRVYRGDTLTAEWINELTLGDSAGRPVMRWVTTSQPVPGNPNRPLSVLRQTYDGITMAPLGYSVTSSTGAATEIAIDGTRARGRRRTATDTTWTPFDLPIERPGFFAGASDLVPIAAGLRLGTVLVAPVWSPSRAAAEDRVFAVLKDTVVTVEGTPVRGTKVEERRRADRSLYANWYLLLESPYMVYGEVPLPDGRVQRMTEVAVPMTGGN